MAMNVVLYYYLLIGVYFFALFSEKCVLSPGRLGQAFLKLISFAGEGGNGNGHMTIT